MSGTKLGGMKAAATNKEKYGLGFYGRIGAKGGMNGHTGGFASNPKLAREAGAKGGAISRRGESKIPAWRWAQIMPKIEAEYSTGEVSMKALARKYNMPYDGVRKRLTGDYAW